MIKKQMDYPTKHCKIIELMDLIVFGKFFNVNNSCNNITTDTITKYKLYLQNKPAISDITIANYLRHLRVILYYLMKKGYITPSFSITIPKTRTLNKKAYTSEELKLILLKPNLRKCSSSDIRNWAVVNYAYGTGNRLRTIVNLKIEDIDFENKTVKLNETKNKKQDIMPLSNQVIKILKEYLSYRKGEPSDYLFCSINTGNKISESGLYHSIAKYCIKCGVSKTGVHRFRHGFALGFLENGGDIYKLPTLMGHETLSMSMEYVHLSHMDIKQKYEEYNPLDSLYRNKGKRINFKKGH